MKKLIRERIEIAGRMVTAAVAARTATDPTGGQDTTELAANAWAAADLICSNAEKMQAEETERLRAAEKEARRKLEEEEAKHCQRPVADGFDGPCTLGPHSDNVPCENKAGDKWQRRRSGRAC